MLWHHCPMWSTANLNTRFIVVTEVGDECRDLLSTVALWHCLPCSQTGAWCSQTASPAKEIPMCCNNIASYEPIYKILHSSLCSQIKHYIFLSNNSIIMCTVHNFVSSKFLTTDMKFTVFWDMMLCGLVSSTQWFIQLSSTQRRPTLKMDSRVSKTLVSSCQTTQCHIQEKNNVHLTLLLNYYIIHFMSMALLFVSRLSWSE
jgi:hypothetical protein